MAKAEYSEPAATPQPTNASSSASTMSTTTAHKNLEGSDSAGVDDLEYVRTHEDTEAVNLGEAEKQQTKLSVHDPRAFPDGGREAWLCVVGGFFCLWCSFGWINCIGLFQAYYEKNQLSEYPPSTVAWISSLEVFCMLAFGLPIGILFDAHGPRMLLLVGTFLHVFGIMMASISTEYWHFILAQGLCSATGTSLIFNAALGSVSTWFHKRRGFVNGIIASGSGLGGVVMPIMIRELTEKAGFPWAMRSVAFMMLGLMVIANLTVKSRIPPKGARRLHLSDFLTPLRDLKYMLTVAGSFFFFLGMFLPMNFLPTFGISNGMSEQLSFYLIAIINSGSIIGRLVPTYIGDKVGRFNVNVFFVFSTSLLVLCVWLPTHGNTATIIFAVLYGVATGAFIGLAPALVAQISNIREIGLRIGILFAFSSLGALAGNPIGGALITKDNGDFQSCQIFTGVCLFIGSLMFLGARWVVAEGKLKVKV